MATPDVPDPTETVTLLKSDFDLLQSIANWAVEDAAALGELLGKPCPEGTAPREHFHLVLLPAVAALIGTQAQVDFAAQQLASMGKRFGNKTIGLPDGRKAVKVGQKIPGLLNGLQPLTRRERREFEREQRRS